MKTPPKSQNILTKQRFWEMLTFSVHCTKASLNVVNTRRNTNLVRFLLTLKFMNRFTNPKLYLASVQ